MKKIIRITAAAAAALLAANLAFSAIYTLPAKYNVTGKITGEVWQKNAPVVLGLEGYAINFTDQNGYNNPDGILDGNYAVAIGSSHTQAFNVFRKQNYCSLYNAYATQNDLPLLYNTGMDANNFCDIVKHFPAAVEQFPDAAYFTVETPYLIFTPKQLKNACKTVTYSDEEQNTDLKSLLYGFAQSMPLARLAVKHILETDTNEIENAFHGATPNESQAADIDYDDYAKALEKCFATLRSATDKPIYLIYHRPYTTAGLSYERIGDHAVLPLVEENCEKYGITLLSTDDAFAQNYKENQTLPYGFYNTVYGEGHLNQTGHQIFASLLKEEIK